jgi:Secretion system C-terminal sorting domain
MKKQLLKKFHAFIVTTMVFSASANAQIIYTDVNPDIIQTCQNFQCSQTSDLDLNNDGVFDSKLDLILNTFTSHNPPNTRFFTGLIKASPLNGSSIITDSSGYPLKMNLNELIDSSGSWSDTANQTLLGKYYAGLTYVLASSYGNWMSATNGFLGLKIVSGTQTYYGWVRLNISMDVTPILGSYKIIDYAYNTIPNQPILAGQTIATGIIENSFASSINLFPNPADNHFTIALGSNNQKVEVTITDITGKIIYTTVASETQKIVVNTNDFNEGIYFVQIQAAGFIATKKLVIEK